MPEKSQFTLRIMGISVLILLVFGIILSELLAYSFWIDEGYTAWIIHDEMREPDSIRETVRFVRDSLLNTVNYVRSDVHPPLYYLLLDVWTLLIGNSEFALRLPSAILATLSLAAIYALGRQLFNIKTGIIALILLGTSGFYLYYAREARMYSLYLTLATLSTWAYILWWHKPTMRRGLLYSIISGLLLYTHYASFTIIVAHLVHSILTVRIWSRKSALWQLFIPFGFTILFFAPWIPFAIRQFEINTGFSAPGAIVSDWGTMAAIWLKLNSGYWGIFALAFILSRALFSAPRKFSEVFLLLLWGLMPVIVLFILNAQGLSVLQLRYLIPIMGAWSLLIAYLLSHMSILLLKNPRLGHLLTIFFTAWIAYTQLATYHIHWGAKPDWRTAASLASDERQSLDPALVYLDERSPLTYYAQQTSLLDGISIHFRWRDFSPQEIQEIVSSLDNSPVVWAFMEMQAPYSWDTIVRLNENRGVSYRDSVQGTILYEFDTVSDDELAFTFGRSGDNHLFAYSGNLYTRYESSANQEICTPIVLETLIEIDEPYVLSLHLTRGYNEVIAQSELTLGSYSAGQSIQQELCVTLPDNGNYHLRLIIFSQQTGLPLYVMESNLLWSNHFILGAIEAVTD